MQDDPETFISALAAADRDQYLKLWGRAISNYCLSGVSPAIAFTAHDALNQFAVQHGRSDLPAEIDLAVQGAFYTLVRCIRELPMLSYQLCRDLALQFESSNPSIAFIGIRQFELYLSSKAIFVADRLEAVAADPARLRPPCPMSIRGIAFAVLYTLDPMYNHWPQLTVARCECVTGCNAWSQTGGPRAIKYQRLACQIQRYLATTT